MKKITIFILVLGILGGVSFLKVFTVTTHEDVPASPPPRPDFTQISKEDYDALYGNGVKVTRKGNFWEFIRN